MMNLVKLVILSCLIVGFVRGFRVVVIQQQQQSSLRLHTPSSRITTCLAADNNNNNDLTTAPSFFQDRRQVIARTAVGAAWILGTPSLSAAADAAAASPEMIRAAFSNVRNQVSEGVSYMQTCIDQQEYAALLEFTKTYDQVLRKGAMGKAKKLLADKQAKELATVYANSVTFDLIGINKSSRPGQENMQTANKYLQELRDDVQKFLELEPNFSD